MTYDETTRFLDAYGLNTVITNRDDPRLWAAILAKYWPLPDSPTMRLWDDEIKWKVSSLRFGIGRPKPRRGPEEIRTVDEWCFERVDASTLQVKKCEHRETSFDNPWIGLEVTRPSKNQSQALVHVWSFHHGRAAHGKVCRWACAPNGDWTEVETLSESMA